MKLTKIFFGVLLLTIGLFSPLNAENLINGWTVINRSSQVGFVGSVFSTDHPIGVESSGSQEFQMHSAPGGIMIIEKSFNNIPMAGANWLSLYWKPAVLNPAQSNTSLDLLVEVSSNNVDFYPVQTVNISRVSLNQWETTFWEKPVQLGGYITKARITFHLYYGGGQGSDTIISHLRLDEFWTSYFSYPVIAIDKFEELTGIEPIGEIAEKYLLSQNYPNPFNPKTNIRFSIPKKEFVTLNIYDALGKEVEMLVSKEINPGTYIANWDASKYASGIYFYKLEAGDFIDTKRMTLVK